jgi:hypothetical protein
VDEPEITKGWKVPLLVCAVVGALLGLVTFAVLSGGSAIGYILAALGGIALGLIVASVIHNLIGWLHILFDRD